MNSYKWYIGCVTKIWTKFNLNFPLYCASARNCCWRPTMLVNSHILKMAAMLKPSTEYNRRAMIIEGLRAERSATEVILFGSLDIRDHSFMILWQNIRL